MRWADFIAGYWLARRRELAATTQAAYANVLRQFGAHVGERPVESLTTGDVLRYLDALAERVSARTVADHWVVLSSLWTWAGRELGYPHIIRGHIPRPHFPKPEIVPFSEDEVRALVRAAEWAAPWTGRAGKPARSKRPTAKRDRAVILTLLDTGLRASELCALERRDYDASRGRLHVRHGKGDKERSVYLGETARKALWQYMAQHERGPGDPLFPTRSGRAMQRGNLRHLLAGIGRNAGVEHVHPHRFRHTFAIQWLRSGGGLVELQRLLGHESLDTVQVYLAIAQSDLQAAQRRHSPADHWRL